MRGDDFELIMQELRNQQQRMEELVAENRELRRQIAEWREGRGIFIEILGKRFALGREAVAVSPEIASKPQNAPSRTQVLPSVTDAPTTFIPETPRPSPDYLVEIKELSPSPAFLEEVILDEFASAATSPMAVWQEPAAKSPTITEDEKAALRRELMGSFLLE